jgi:hypothetical protein
VICLSKDEQPNIGIDEGAGCNVMASITAKTKGARMQAPFASLWQ